MFQQKDKDWLNGYKTRPMYTYCLKEPHFRHKDTNRLKVRGWKNIFHPNEKQKKAGVAILISNKIDLKIKITWDKEGHYTMINGSTPEEDIAIVNTYAPKNWCFWTVVLEKTLESSLDCKEIQPVHHKGDKSWVFIGRTDAEAESPILWPPDAKSWLIWKHLDAEKDWGQEKGMAEDEMVGWNHWLNGHGFGWTVGVGDGQGGLVCCGSWGHKESDTTEHLNWLTDPK